MHKRASLVASLPWTDEIIQAGGKIREANRIKRRLESAGAVLDTYACEELSIARDKLLNEAAKDLNRFEGRLAKEAISAVTIRSSKN
jgi:CHAD domain-containing protein